MLLGRKDVPEAESLVACACDQRLTVWARRQVQHPVGVARERGNLLHGRVAPDVDLVLAVAVRRHEFIDVLSEHQIADLAASVDGLEVLQLNRVPELDSSVLGAATGREQSLLVRGPCDGFDSCLVLVKLDQGLRAAARTPKQKFVIVAA